MRYLESHGHVTRSSELAKTILQGTVQGGRRRGRQRKGWEDRIGNAIGPYEDLLTSVKRRKLKWYGHVTQSSGLAKTILQGTVQGGRRRGRQRKRWEDNIKEWTGLEWNIILRKAENREEEVDCKISQTTG